MTAWVDDRSDSHAATTETQKFIRRNVYFIPAPSSSRAVSCVRRTLKLLFLLFVELLSADLHCMLPDAACAACSTFSHSQTAGEAFMFGCKNQLEVRRFPLAPSHILPPLAIHRQELSAQLWVSLMRLTDVSSRSAHRSEDTRVHMRQQQEYLCTPVHAASQGGVGELTRLHKGTLFNLLHIKARAQQAGACGHVSVSPTLKRFSTAVSSAEDGVSETAQRERVNLASHCYDNPKSTQKPTQPFERAQRAFLHH